MRIQMENIILTGYMGSGKTTVGKNVAKLKAYTFLDTDEMIVQQQRRSINEIFATAAVLSARISTRMQILMQYHLNN